MPPWEKYQQQPAAEPGPWDKFKGQAETWERAVLLPMETNTATGERRWAVPGFVEGIVGAAALPGDVATGKTSFDPALGYENINPADLDRAAVLASLPQSGSFASKPASARTAAANGRQLPKLVADQLDEAGYTTPTAINAGLEALGPSAVLGDLTPRLQARVGAIATTPGPGQDIVIDAMRQRLASANPRIRQTVEDIFGPEPIPSVVGEEIAAAKTAANAGYPPVLREKALSDNYLYDAAPLFSALDEQVPNFVGETRTNISRVRDMLINPATGELTTDPQVILAVRHELDGMIDGMTGAQGGNRTTVAALRDMRRLVDNDLAQQVPGIKWVDAAKAEASRAGEAFETGRTVLSGGANPMHPRDLDLTLDALRGPAGTAVGPRRSAGQGPLRLSQGTLSKIYEAIGTTANDRVALKQLLKGEGSWNREKLASVFGEAKARKLIDLLDAEATMATTENLAIGNSKTEMLRSAKEGIEARPRDAGVIENLGNLRVGSAAAKGADYALGGFLHRQQMERNRAIAEALMSRPGSIGMGGGRGSYISPGLSKSAYPAIVEALIEQGDRGGVLRLFGP